MNGMAVISDLDAKTYISFVFRWVDITIKMIFQNSRNGREYYQIMFETVQLHRYERTVTGLKAHKEKKEKTMIDKFRAKNWRIAFDF